MMRAASIMTEHPAALSVAPVPAMPRVKMAAEHDDFVRFVAFPESRRSCCSVQVRVLELDSEVYRHRHLFTGVDHACKAIVSAQQRH